MYLCSASSASRVLEGQRGQGEWMRAKEGKDRYRLRDGEGEEERACPVRSLKGWLHRSFPSLHVIYIFPKCSLWFVVSLTLEKLYSLSNYDNKKNVLKKS